MFKFSIYNISVEDERNVVLYNTLSSSVISLSKEEYREVLKSVSDNVIDNKVFWLFKNGFLVDSNKDEVEVVKKRYEENFEDKNKLNLTLLPAEYCNLTCPYCFIYNYQGGYMKKELVDSVLKFVRNRIERSDRDKIFQLNLNWYGGEPLLCKDMIFYFMDRLNEMIDEYKNIDLTSGITTNGVLLDIDTFDRLVESKVKTIQITFDGDKIHHDKIRKSRDGKGSFDQIISNLKAIKKSCKLKFSFLIRINFLRSSIESIKELIGDLVDIIGDDKRFSIYCRPVYSFETERKSEESLTDDIYSLEEGLEKQQELACLINEKREESRKIDVLDFLPKSKKAYCHQDNMYSFTIASNGDIYKCDTLLGDKKYKVGTLKEDGIVELDKDSKWNKSTIDLLKGSKCMSCKLLPICVGGCKRHIILNDAAQCFIKEKDIEDKLKELL